MKEHLKYFRQLKTKTSTNKKGTIIK